MSVTQDLKNYDLLEKNNPNSTKIYALGDSWLAYPRKYLAIGEDSNIADILGASNEHVIYSSARNGDEAVAMVCGDKKMSIMKTITSRYFDLIIFSGGGNDIVGKYDLDYFLNETGDPASPKSYIKQERFDRKLAQIGAAYQELIERSLESSVNRECLKILTHTYDFVIPQEKGFRLFDVFPIGSRSWMWGIMKTKGIKSQDCMNAVAKILLEQFRDLLLAIQNKYAGSFFVVDTQGTVTNNQWRNEIHPTPDGFKLITNKIKSKMDEILPSQRLPLTSMSSVMTK